MLGQGSTPSVGGGVGIIHTNFCVCIVRIEVRVFRFGEFPFIREKKLREM